MFKTWNKLLRIRLFSSFCESGWFWFYVSEVFKYNLNEREQIRAAPSRKRPSSAESSPDPSSPAKQWPLGQDNCLCRFIQEQSQRHGSKNSRGALPAKQLVAFSDNKLRGSVETADLTAKQKQAVIGSEGTAGKDIQHRCGEFDGWVRGTDKRFLEES